MSEFSVIEDLVYQVEDATSTTERKRLLQNYIKKFQTCFNNKKYLEADNYFCAITLAVEDSLFAARNIFHNIAKQYCCHYSGRNCGGDFTRAYIDTLLDSKFYITDNIDDHIKTTVWQKIATHCIACPEGHKDSKLIGVLRRKGIKKTESAGRKYTWIDDRYRLHNSFEHIPFIKQAIEDYRILEDSLKKNLNSEEQKVIRPFLFDGLSPKKISSFYSDMSLKQVGLLIRQSTLKLKNVPDLQQMVRRLKTWEAWRKDPKNKRWLQNDSIRSSKLLRLTHE